MANPVFIGSNSATSSSATSVHLNYTSTTGNALVISGAGPLNATLTISDANNNTFNNVYTVNSTPANATFALWIATNITGSNEQVTLSSSTSGALELILAEYSGLNTSAVQDGHNSGTGSTTAMSSGNVTTTNAEDLLIAYLGPATSISNAGTGWTSRVTTTFNNVLAEKIVSSTGTYSNDATQSTTGTYVDAIAAFKSPGGSVVQPTLVATSLATAIFKVHAWPKTQLFSTALATATFVPRLQVAAVRPKLLSTSSSTASVTARAMNLKRASLIATASSNTVFATPHLLSLKPTVMLSLSGAVFTPRAIAPILLRPNNPIVTFVQGNTAGGPASTFTVPFPSAQIGGNCNVVCLQISSAVTVTSISDTAGNTYTLSASQTVAAMSATFLIYIALNVAPSSNNTVTVTLSNLSMIANMEIASYSGLSLAKTLLQSATASGTSGTSNTGPTITTLLPYEFILGYCGATGPISPTGGWTTQIIDSTNSGNNLAVYLLAAVPGPFTPGLSFTSGNWAVTAVGLATPQAFGASAVSTSAFVPRAIPPSTVRPLFTGSNSLSSATFATTHFAVRPQLIASSLSSGVFNVKLISPGFVRPLPVASSTSFAAFLPHAIITVLPVTVSASGFYVVSTVYGTNIVWFMIVAIDYSSMIRLVRSGPYATYPLALAALQALVADGSIPA